MRKKKKTKLVKHITKKLEKVRVIESAFWYLFLNLNSDFPHKKNVFKGDIPAESLEKILQKNFKIPHSFKSDFATLLEIKEK